MLQLPDYNEIIEHPMDFSTIRKKLVNGLYADLEQFERDVFLICSNAMLYNSSDTIYFRQARSIQELAKKDFENLRHDSDDNESQPEPKVVRRGRPPTKNLKRPPVRPPLERANFDISERIPPTSVVNTNRLNTVDTRRGTPLLERFGPAEIFEQSFYVTRDTETYIGWSSERYEKTDDITGSASKGILMKHGKKQFVFDENWRNTYMQNFAFTCQQEPSVLTFNEQKKQLIAVGLHMKYGYARSLARFATKLGPIAWKVASKKIYKCLPVGVKFGPGWIGETEAPTDRPILVKLLAANGQPSESSFSLQGVSLPTPIQCTVEMSSDKVQNTQGEPEFEACASSMEQVSDDRSNECKTLSSSVAGNNTSSVNMFKAGASSNHNTTFNMSNSVTGAMKDDHLFQNQQTSNIQSSFGAAMHNAVNPQSNSSVVRLSRTEIQNLRLPSAVNNGSRETNLPLNSCAVKPSERLSSIEPHQKTGSAQPDLIAGFQSPGSPHSGKADSVQPDLGLQL